MADALAKKAESIELIIKRILSYHILKLHVNQQTQEGENWKYTRLAEKGSRLCTGCDCMAKQESYNVAMLKRWTDVQVIAIEKFNR